MKVKIQCYLQESFFGQWPKYSKKFDGSGGIRTHASEETGALNQRLRPLGHATLIQASIPSFDLSLIVNCEQLTRFEPVFVYGHIMLNAPVLV